MEFQVSLTPQAKYDLEEIGRYVARTDAVAAPQFCDELVYRVQSLKDFPRRHGRFTRRPNIRKLPYKNYLIFYKIHEDTQVVEILRF